MSKTILEFYGGKKNVIFEERMDKEGNVLWHAFYDKKTGEKIISVTEALKMINKPALIPWAIKTMRERLIEQRESGAYIGIPEIIDASKIYVNIRKEAADKGKLIHLWIEKYLGYRIKGDHQGTPDMPEDEQVANGIMAFLKWEKEAGLKKWVASERKIYSRKHNYCGILDAKAIFKTGLSVVDFKSSNGLYNETRYQVAAYQEGDQEELGTEYSGIRWALRFDKNTAEFEARPYDNQEGDFEAFLAALTLKRRDNELSDKIKKIKPAVELPY
jgi:hypothetical protein